MSPEMDRVLRTLVPVEGPEGRVRVVGMVGTEGALDGLHYAVYRGEDGRWLWVHLTGGVAGLDQWHGPVGAEGESGTVLLREVEGWGGKGGKMGYGL